MASGRAATSARDRRGELELDLEVFNGPFDLLLTLVLREEVDLLEIELAEVVLAYLDVLEARGELDLEAATDFLVLIAALLELKSRLMFPGDEDGLLDLEPGEAAEELLARLLDAIRYRGAADFLHEQLESQDGMRFRSARCLTRSTRSPTTTSRRSMRLARSVKPWAGCSTCRRGSTRDT